MTTLSLAAEAAVVAAAVAVIRALVSSVRVVAADAAESLPSTTTISPLYELVVPADAAPEG